MAWTTADLISAVKRQTFMPDTADLVDSTRGQFTDAELLAFADEEIATSFVDLLRALRDESRIVYFDTASATVGPQRISLPERAMMRAVRRIHYVSPTGVEGYMIDPIAPADSHLYSNGAGWMSSPRACWIFDGDDVVLPMPPGDGSIRIYYQRAFPRCALLSDCAKVLTIAGTTVTTDDRPTWMAVGEIADIVRGSTPFPMLEIDSTVSALPGASTFTLSPFTSVASVSQPGALTTKRIDYVCRAGETAYPPLPQEWHAALASCVAVRVLEAIGDVQATDAARALRDRRLDACIKAATPRNAGRDARIVNRGSPLRGNGARRGWW